MNKLCRALARGTHSDERALKYGMVAIGLSLLLASLLHLA
jgi:hypothetical protein